MRRIISLLALCLAALVATLPATTTAPASADEFIRGECQWKPLDRVHKEKICTGIWHYFSGSRVTDGISVYQPPGGPFPSYSIGFNLADVAADGKCTWIRVRRVKTAWPTTKVQPGTTVCGKGESKNINLRFYEGEHSLGMVPGVLLIQHCWPSNCTTFAKQRIPLP